MDGVSGIFRKPYEGAKNGGLSGFSKGLGKGAIGLVANPGAGTSHYWTFGCCTMEFAAFT